MARVRVLTMKFPRVTKIGQSIASMRTTPQVSGLGPVTVYITRFKCRPGPSLPLPTGLGPPESSTRPSPVDTFTLPPFLPSRARPGSSPLDLWQCKRGLCAPICVSVNSCHYVRAIVYCVIVYCAIVYCASVSVVFWYKINNLYLLPIEPVHCMPRM